MTGHRPESYTVCEAGLTFSRVYRRRRYRFAKPDGTCLASELTSILGGEESVEPGIRTRAGITDGLILQLTYSGSAHSIFNGRSFDHRPGRLSCSDKGISHAREIGPDGPWHSCYLDVSGPLIEPISSALKQYHGRVLAIDDPGPLADTLAQAVEAVMAQTSAWDWSVLAAVSAIGQRILSVPADDDLVERIRGLTEAEPANPWRLPSLAHRLGLSEAAMVHRLRSTSGLAPSVWVRRCRMAIATRLLLEGHSVTATAETLGFMETSHFTRCFIGVEGFPPSQARVRLTNPR